MKVLATPQSPVSISVTWIYELGDDVPASVVIHEYGPDGTLIASQPNPQPVGGAALFTGLKPSTTYRYEWCGVFPSESGDLTSCHPESVVTGTTPPQQPPVPTPPTPSPGPPTPGPAAGSVSNIEVKAVPFGKIIVSWDPAGHKYSALFVHRYQANFDTFSIEVSTGNTFMDTGPFIEGSAYNYLIETTYDRREFQVSHSPDVIYPDSFGLKQYLPAHFDPSHGIKRLFPNAHPFVSVRQIMSGK